MILHSGIDGGLHDLLLNNLVATFTYGALSINAGLFYARRWWAWRKLNKAPKGKR